MVVGAEGLTGAMLNYREFAVGGVEAEVITLGRQASVLATLWERAHFFLEGPNSALA